MAASDLTLFFLQLILLLGVGFLGGQIMKRLGQPAILGELLGGVLLGPSIFGLIFRNLHHTVFPAQGATFEMRSGVVTIGMLFFLFVAGLEIDLEAAWKNRRTALYSSLLGMAVPFTLGAASVLALPSLWGAPAARGAPFAVFMGAALCISALPVIVRILMDSGQLRTRCGTVTAASAIVDDLVGWSLFAFSLSMLAPSTQGHGPLASLVLVVVLAAVMIVLGRWLGLRFFLWVRSLVGEAGSLLAAISILILLGALLAELAGVHAVFGAFLVGVALGPVLKHTPCANTVISQFALSFFAPLYFVSIGLRADFVNGFDPMLCLFVLVVAAAGKLLGAGAGALLGGMSLREAAFVAFGLNARGAMEMILAGVALEAGIIDQRIFVALIVMTLVTTIASVPLLKALGGGRGLSGDGLAPRQTLA